MANQTVLADKYMTKVIQKHIARGSSLEDVIDIMEPDSEDEVSIRRVYAIIMAKIAPPEVAPPTSQVNKQPLRPYQQQTVSECQQVLNASDRCFVQLPTGAGKTRVMYKLIDDDFESVKNTNNGRLEPGVVYICMSPRIDLAKQHFRSDRAKDMDTPFRLINFYSKVDDFTVDALYCEWSRDKEALIISGLYQSLDRLKAWLETRQLTKRVRYVFSDEAHMIARWCQPKVLEREPDINWFMTGIWNPHVKRVFMSATPTEKQVIDLDRYWGPLIKPVTVGQLITTGILCPIETLIPNVRVTESIDKKTGDMRTELDSRSICEILYKELVHTNAQKTVVFCNTTAKCRELRDLFIRESKSADVKIKAYLYVSGQATNAVCNGDSMDRSEDEESENEEFVDIMSPKYKNLAEERCGEIVKFEQCKTPAAVFVCKKISMGYDFPPIDFIAFADPKCAKAELAQCIGRGLRTFTSKTVCRVFIPITPADYMGDTRMKRRHLTLFEYLNYLRDELGLEYRINDRSDITRKSQAGNGGVGGSMSSARAPMTSVTLNVFGNMPGYDFLDENKVCLILAKESVLNNQKTDFSWDNYNRVQYDYYKSRNREYGFKTVKEYFNCVIEKFTDWLDPTTIDVTTMFGKYWKGWYDFLGIDTSKFPTSMDAWIVKCRELGISCHSKYYESLSDNPDLPDEPGYLYSNFTNINACLGATNYRRR